MFDTPKAFASLSSGLLARKGAAKPAMRPQGFGQTGASLEDLGWNDMGFEAPKPSVAAQDRDADHDAFGDAVAEQPIRSPVSALTPSPAISGGAGTFPKISPARDQQANLAQQFGAERLEAERLEAEQAAAERIEIDRLAADATEAGEPEEGEEEDEAYDVDEAQDRDEALPIAVAAEPVGGEVHPVPTLSIKPRILAAQATQVAEPEEPAAPPVAHVPVAAVEPVPIMRAPVAQRAANGAGPKAAFTLRLDTARHLKLRLACALTGRSAQMMVTEALDRLLDTYPELENIAGQLPMGGRSRRGQG